MPKIDGDFEAHLVALSCSAPEGFEYTPTWKLAEYGIEEVLTGNV